jgi:hypothetical protein
MRVGPHAASNPNHKETQSMAEATDSVHLAKLRAKTLALFKE